MSSLLIVASEESGVPIRNRCVTELPVRRRYSATSLRSFSLKDSLFLSIVRCALIGFLEVTGKGVGRDEVVSDLGGVDDGASESLVCCGSNNWFQLIGILGAGKSGLLLEELLEELELGSAPEGA